jgi:hypothetical protein
LILLLNELILKLDLQMILYETSSHYYIVGFDSEEASFRVLKIDRRVLSPKSLDEILQEDPCVYSKEALAEMLEMVNEGTVLLVHPRNIDGCSHCTIAVRAFNLLVITWIEGRY